MNSTPRRLLGAVVLIAAAVVGGCRNHSSFPTQPTAIAPPAASPPSPAPMPVPPATNVQAMAIGESVEGIIHSYDSSCTSNIPKPCRQFDVTAPRAGTLVVTVTWDPYYWDTLLFLRLNGAEIPSTIAPYSPLVGRLAVSAGQTYRLGVGIYAAGTQFESGFKLTTTLE